jgi:hypothetical protein
MGSMMEENPLLIIYDESTGQQWERFLTEDVVVMGRDENCELTLPGRQISRRHATIFRRGDRYFLRDEGSRNGTFLDGGLVTTAQTLQDGAEVCIADRYRLIFVASEATAPLYRPGPTQRGIYLDRANRGVWVDGTELDPPLSAAQYRLLEYLYNRAGAICTRDEIVDVVWREAGIHGITDQAIDALMRRLRGRLAAVGSEQEFIETIRGHGFRLVQP